MEIFNSKNQDYTAGVVFPNIKRDYGTHILRTSEINRKNLNASILDFEKLQIIKEAAAQRVIYIK